MSETIEKLTESAIKVITIPEIKPIEANYTLDFLNNQAQNLTEDIQRLQGELDKVNNYITKLKCLG